MPFKVLSSRLPNFQLLYQRLQVSLDPLLSTSPVQIAWIAQSISNCTGYLCLCRWTEPFLSRVSCSPIWLRTNAENAPLLLKYPKSEHVHESSLFHQMHHARSVTNHENTVNVVYIQIAFRPLMQLSNLTDYCTCKWALLIDPNSLVAARICPAVRMQ